MEDLHSGFALVINEHGIIEKILECSIDLLKSKLTIGNSIHKISYFKAIDWNLFLKEMIETRAIFNWILQYEGENVDIPMYLNGCRIGNQMLLVGSLNQQQLNLFFYEQMMEINNIQMNQLRTLLKEKAERERTIQIKEDKYVEELSKLNNELINIQRQITKKNTQLEKALAEVKTLKGLLPICANCKKVRNDGGYWESVEDYISTRTDTEFSHGLCPECLYKIYPEGAKEILDSINKSEKENRKEKEKNQN